MKRQEQFFIVPFTMKKGRLQPGEPRRAKSEGEAVDTALALWPRFGGAVAVGLILDVDTGELLDPRELARFGEVPEDLGQAA